MICAAAICGRAVAIARRTGLHNSKESGGLEVRGAFLFSIFLLFIATLVHAGPAADMVLLHAKIWTVDAKLPEAEALAVIGDRIVAVGSNAEIDAWRGPNTKVLDANGRR